jgi:hypothetical protein
MNKKKMRKKKREKRNKNHSQVIHRQKTVYLEIFINM